MTHFAPEKVAQSIQQLPSLSVVVLKILSSFEKEEADIPTLVREIGQDQGVAARVLRVANSAFYGFPGKIGSIGEAVVVLGFHNIRALVAAAGIIAQFPPGEGKVFDRLAFWQHSIGTAVCAKVLAARLDMDAELAFTAGLLHDIGKLVLDAYFHDHFIRVLEYRTIRDCDLLEAEGAMLGMDHGAIGFEVAKRWKLPPQIQLAIRDHHRPTAGDDERLADLVHLANVLCHALDIGNSGYDWVPPLSADAFSRLGLSLRDVKGCLGEIERLNAGANLLATD